MGVVDFDDEARVPSGPRASSLHPLRQGAGSMTSADTASASGRAALRDISAQLAETLDRRVTILGAVDHPDPGSLQRPGALEHSVTVPVRADADVVAHIAVQTDDSTLGPADFEAIDAAAALVGDVLRDGLSSPRDRESVLRDVLVDDEDRRRAAYAYALEQRWLYREEGTVVRALLIDAAVSSIQSVAFARQLGRLRPVPSFFAGARSGTIFLVGQPTDEGVEELILREAAKRRIRVLGMGSASPARGDDDLRGAADEAAIAASLAAALPQFHPAVDARDLGGWLLLASSSASPSHLRIISPAAHALRTHRDQSQRLTIETYLDVGANVVAACEILFLHRTTLYYRLERMPDVVKEALADGVKRSALHLALKLVRLWEATGRI
jgi:hypothetical protein